MTLSSRRRFLIQSAATVAGAALGGGILFANRKWVFGPRRGTLMGGMKILVDGTLKTYFAILDLDQSNWEPTYVSIPFFPHGIAFHPKNPSLLSVFEKIGPGAAELNLKTKRMRIISTSNDRYFYGHGAYSKDGSKLFSVETNTDNHEGVIAVRDPSSLEQVDVFPSFGSNPHDCQLIEDGRVLAVTNGGGKFGTPQKACVTYVDVESRKLLKKFEIEDERLNAGHLFVSGKKELAVVSAPRLGLTDSDSGAISLKLKEDQLVRLTEPKEVIQRLKAETLSVCMDQKSGIVAATSPLGNIVTFWEMATGRLVKSLEIENPRGIALTRDGRHYLISQGGDSNLLAVNTKNLDIDPSLGLQKSAISGSHLYIR
ncbi:MAG: DUF1513 domain-containing protein [Bdellovibrionales bacterium]|nr:DUF1513 domain-containing protein [Bdellovibrionales bacterium]